MGWSVGFDSNWGRDIGYSIVAYCDHPDCNAEIYRGLANVCANQEPYGGDGCGLYFCSKHLFWSNKLGFCCERCLDKRKKSFEPKPEHSFWICFKLRDPSWAAWHKECPDEAKEFQDMWDKLSPEAKANAEKITKKEMAWQVKS